MTHNYKQDYFEWLCEIVGVDRPNGDSYRILLGDLNDTLFYSVLPHDENRIGDGLDLRDEYAEVERVPEFIYVYGFDTCSVLEALIGMARRMEYETNDPPDKWFWEIIGNLGLSACTDDRYESGDWPNVDRIIKNWMNRKYDRDGRGGAFPLQHTRIDQREVEIWYQMNAYLNEGGLYKQ